MYPDILRHPESISAFNIINYFRSDKFSPFISVHTAIGQLIKSVGLQVSLSDSKL